MGKHARRNEHRRKERDDGSFLVFFSILESSSSSSSSTVFKVSESPSKPQICVEDRETAVLVLFCHSRESCVSVLVSSAAAIKMSESEAKDAFIIFDESYEGNDVDAHYLADILRAVGCNVSNAAAARKELLLTIFPPPSCPPSKPISAPRDVEKITLRV